MALYIFDMDGTLTPARQRMNDDFAFKFSNFQQNNKTFIASGSDLKKISEQISFEVMNNFTGIYCSMGNMLWVKGNIVYKNEFNPDIELFNMLEKFRSTTLYPYKLYQNYIEKRIGMINFSVLGRDCPYSERDKYSNWDKQNGERLKIQKILQDKFPEYDISVGGSISIDITKKGYSKGQIANHIRKRYQDEEIIFMGDKTFKGGNDFELAEALRQIPNTKIIQVDGPQDVINYLKI